MQYTHNSRGNPNVFSFEDKDHAPKFDARELVSLFNQNFSVTHNSLGRSSACSCTRLYGNASEPIYLPSNAALTDYFYENTRLNNTPKSGKLQWLSEQTLSELPEGNKIFFTRDYFASALHEIAHWCLAGAERRQKVDYGYWYAPDGRDAQQQAAFEQAELKPQALEWAFSIACGKPFSVSNDNLKIDNPDNSEFSAKVYEQLQRYIANGFGKRAEQFLMALNTHFSTPDIRNIDIAPTGAAVISKNVLCTNDDVNENVPVFAVLDSSQDVCSQ